MKQFVAGARALALSSYVTVVANGAAEPRQCRLRRPPALAPQTVRGEPSTLAPDNNTLTLGARRTGVHLWK